MMSDFFGISLILYIASEKLQVPWGPQGTGALWIQETREQGCPGATGAVGWRVLGHKGLQLAALITFVFI